jgi:hypothetical protein
MVVVAMEIFSPIMVDLKGKLIDDRELVVPAIAFEQAFLFDELERLKRRLAPGYREWLRDVDSSVGTSSIGPSEANPVLTRA